MTGQEVAFVVIAAVGTIGALRVVSARNEPSGGSPEQVGESIFRSFVLPFEVVSFLLLAALIGAIVLARKDDGDGS